ncbi:MAG: hypothetical protein HOM58_04410 [Rhodospirillaceae bacterium]|jgi:hypothetical protein|nr:hypothetical protein [Rhodospirillaceae bacterium]
MGNGGTPPSGLATKLMIGLGASLWLFGVIRIFRPDPLVIDILSVLLVCFVLLALPRTGWHTRILLGVLALATAGLAAGYDRWDAILLGLAKGSVFPAFLATIVLLRATADQRPEIITARRLFAAIDPRQQAGGLVIGSFLVGSILQVGMFAILAPILGQDATLEERRRVFLVAMRGIALMPMWSPFVVGMAVVTVYLPSVPLWQIMALGLSLGALGILLSVMVFDRTGGPATIWRALKSLSPIVPAIAVAAFLVIGMTTISGYSTLQSLVIIIPVPCLLAVAFAPGGNVPLALRRTAMGLSRIGNETSILTLAMVLGITFETCLPAIGLLDTLKSAALSPTLVIFIIIMAMNLFGLMGIHSIVSGTILLVLFTSIPTGVADLILLEALLVGWGLCTALSVGSLSIATGAAMFDLQPHQGISALNILYVFVTSALFAAILAAINPLLTG